MSKIVYDTGALLAAERQNPDFIKLHEQLKARRIRPVVPIVVLAQSWRGGPQHRLSMVLKGCEILPGSERLGRAAGAACAAAGTTDVVDAIVVATAIAQGASVITSDSGDLKLLADAIGVKLRLVPI